LHAGLVQPWAPRIVKLRGGKVTEVTPQRPRFVGSPTMNHLAKHLAQDLIVHRERLITSVSRCGDRAGHRDRWQLIDEHAESAGAFDIVLVNCPPPQAAHILPDDSAVAPSLRQVKMLPRWAAMIYCQRPSPLPFDAAHVSGNPLAWIARDNSKPRRQAVGQAWVLHANPEWTDEHLGEDREDIVPALLEAFEQATGVMFTEPSYAVAHRWLYAEAEEALPKSCLWDASEGLGACGDWCGSAGVEGAFLSGAALAGNVLRHLTIDRAATTVAAAVYPA
jgi:predicted NAD/FAD-dependent oxidoreductase